MLDEIDRKRSMTPLIVAMILFFASSFTWVNLPKLKSNANEIKNGNLILKANEFDPRDISINSVSKTSISNQIENFKFTLTNEGNLSKFYSIYLDDIILNDGEESIPDKYIKYKLTKDGSVKKGYLTDRVLDSGIINSDKTVSYTLQLWIDKNTDLNILGATFRGTLRIEDEQYKTNISEADEISYGNPHIKAIYMYDENRDSSSFCLGGEESSCKQIAEDTKYEIGTIVKYEVKKGTLKYFNVINDNGDTLTMQERENTIDSIYWSDLKNSEGPKKILNELDDNTNEWIYVNSQDYQMGITFFGKESFKSNSTGCFFLSGSYPNNTACVVNTYTLPEKKVKSRMITAQEAGNIGCKMGKFTSSSSCKKFMYNYLNDSIKYGGSQNDSYNESIGYWTMSAQADNTKNALNISNTGNIVANNISYDKLGVRAVVVINK